ncbi:MAG: beta-phosphoglucomutase [Epulopiscium sp.]|jgi:beta-phosphoglucomutase|uniref:Beta-phosphoglucomutase n=1 Tax=Defluviitalea raffinosedens TaxID=1450156 RepID=A0A7C8LG40_9FIRM|nr:beta-phosphoglucomutase [Defluviitalea raffinosedens]MBZ4667342.1 Beta-phosphoglucomutase [Defluviitaleaceae bacterium]MDK2787638.1 beta-phosphoglucomutase [Candidatus Epulonipiscium sp.]KAE9632914.1 beta-phosphoglucomutase [Defluviitalea raffinosedens]MBM7684607.1 beta-phosphoglucomutase [Defluviitalea raffinosedens]HHW68292.1 beta-phosphoglucomutase [Candidatus Epulonipiscium sp.]
MVKGVIFDLDGVITDTAGYHFLAWSHLAKEIGIEIDEEFNEKLKGVSRMESLEAILKYGNKENEFTWEEKEALATKKNEHYKELIQNISKKDILPGIEALLKELKANNIKIALGSASKNAPVILKQLGIEEYFDYVVDANQIKNSKPAPDIFIDALKGLNLKPEEAVGVEDAEAGIEAIHGAGMVAIGVGVNGDVNVNSTEELTYDVILRASKVC